MDIRNKKKCTAIVLAAGQGKRMGTSIQKQYIELEGKPLICYALKVFQESEVIDDIVFVAGMGQIDYVRQEIIEKYGFDKVSAVVEGGKERYDSVWRGLKALNQDTFSDEEGESYVFVHDGARPFVSEEILRRGYEAAMQYRACVAGMPSKDTVKLVDAEDFAIKTPERKYVWAIQTPQIFEKNLIIEAYSRIMREKCINVTDDAMVVEQMTGVPVKLFEGSYENIKVTTPDDLKIARAFISASNESCG